MPHSTTVISKVWTESELKRVQKDPELAGRLGRVLGPKEQALSLPQGGAFVFGSTQPKKIHDAEMVFRNQSARLDMIDPIRLLHWFLSADEISKTFVGNAYEKAQSILERIYDDLGYQEVAAHLKELGYNPQNVIFCVNDCGMAFTQNFSAEPEFARSLHERGHGPWPGVELGPIMDAQGGLQRFFLDLKMMVERKRQLGEPVDLSGTDYQTYMMFRISPDRKNVKLYSYEASIPVRFVTEPRGQNSADVLTSFHYALPMDDNTSAEDQGQTCAELGDRYMTNYSAESHALSAFLTHAQVPQSIKPAFDAAKGKSRRPFVLSTPANVLNLGGQTGLKRPRRFKLGGFALNQTRINPLQNGAYQALTVGADAVVFDRHPEKVLQNWDDHFLDLFDLWCSLIVDKQVRVETFEGRPFLVRASKNTFTYDGKTNGDLDWNDPAVEVAFLDYIAALDPRSDPWGQMIAFTQYLHAEGFVKQQPRFLFKEYEKFDRNFRTRLKEKLQAAPTSAEIPRYRTEQFGVDRTDLPEITILGSAGTRVQAYTDSARDLGEWVAKNFWHLRTGGGRYGVMGAASEGAFQFIQKNPQAAGYMHISAIQMPRTLQFEGVSLKPSDFNEAENLFLSVEPSFDDRMTSLFRSDVLISLAGGIGTYQEIARFLRLKEAGVKELQGKKMFLVNQQQPGKAGQIRVFDVFLNVLPKKYHDDLIVVPDVAAAKIEAQRIIDRKFNSPAPSFDTPAYEP